MDREILLPMPKSYTSVQALRAVAALSVVAFHISENIARSSGEVILGGVFRKGFLGVDLFFVVSGFIIAHSSGRYAGRPEKWGSYLSRRFFRIFPLYWMTLIPLLGFLLLIPHSRLVSHLPELNLKTMLATVFLLPGHNEINAVSWTLSFEWYFYLLFGLVIVSRKAGWVLAALALATLANGVALWFQGIDSGRELIRFFFLSPLNLEFAIGTGVAWLTANRRFSAPWLPVTAGVLIIVLFCPEKPWDLNRVWSLGPGAGLVLLGITQAEQQKGLRIPGWLGVLGDASYPLYLLHFPIIIFCNKVMVILGQQSVSMRGMMDLVLTAGMCWLSIRIHRHIEAPLMKRVRHRVSPGPVKEKTP